MQGSWTGWPSEVPSNPKLYGAEWDRTSRVSRVPSATDPKLSSMLSVPFQRAQLRASTCSHSSGSCPGPAKLPEHCSPFSESKADSKQIKVHTNRRVIWAVPGIQHPSSSSSRNAEKQNLSPSSVHWFAIAGNFLLLFQQQLLSHTHLALCEKITH